MRYLITGIGGFIGSNLANKLLSLGEEVIGIDNFSTGNINFINSNLIKRNKIFSLDITKDINQLQKIVSKSHFVFHLAANADIRFGVFNPTKDVKQNIIGTHNVLEAMRKTGVHRIAFSSTGSVYGETNIIPTPEESKLENQTSFYSASKASAEMLIQSYSEAYGFDSYIFRFVSVLGKNYHHGHVIDFYNQLKKNPDRLKVLGDGNQKKSYIHVSDCVDGMLYGILNSKNKINTYNLGTEETITVKESIKIIMEYLKLSPKIEYGTEKRGWIGDNPLIYLDINKIKALGWKPSFTIRQGIIDTLQYLESVDKKWKH